VGADQTLTTASTPPPPTPPPASGSGHATIGHVSVLDSTASVPASCSGLQGQTCNLTLTMTVTETLKGHRLVTITARKQIRTHRKVVVVGSARVTLTADQTRVAEVALNRAGKALLAKHHPLKVTLHVAQTLTGHHTVTVARRTLTFKAPNRHHKH
jgi:hypothetical protein